MKMFDKLIESRIESKPFIECMENTVLKLLEEETSSQKPGILLGKIQSGKTRAFIGIMALAYDMGYDMSIILTKGTKALVRQTVQRIERDFARFIEDDLTEVFDIMIMPDNLTKYERVGCEIYRTDIVGAIMISSDGKRYRIRSVLKNNS